MRRAIVGLATIVLLLSMFSTVSSTIVPDCCRGKMCPIHHKQMAPTSANKNSHMDCGHEGAGLDPCSMSCSHPEDEQLQSTVVFLLPDVSLSFESLPTESARLVALAHGSSRSVRPVIPPPRFQVSSL